MPGPLSILKNRFLEEIKGSGYGKLRIVAQKLGEPSWLSRFFRGSHRIFSSALAFHVSITISLVCKLSGLSGQSKVKPIMAGQVIQQSHCFFAYNYIVTGPGNPWVFWSGLYGYKLEIFSTKPVLQGFIPHQHKDLSYCYIDLYIDFWYNKNSCRRGFNGD